MPGSLLVVGLLLAALLAPSSHSPSSHSRASRPNVVVVMTDDQRVDDMAYMPKTRVLLAQHGVTFDQLLRRLSLCCPSRATYLTGQYNHNNGVRLDAAQQRRLAARAICCWTAIARCRSGCTPLAITPLTLGSI